VTTIVLTVPRSFYLTANGRYHWAEKARRTRWLRHLATINARAIRLDYTQAAVVAYIAYPKGTGRVDPNNAAPTTKALLDGCIDAGVLPDDDSRHLLGPDHRRDTNTCTSDYRIRLVFTEVPA
jgi:crossover junction endodeoxyribonuclease RusA